jgi:hypothetical protein
MKINKTNSSKNTSKLTLLIIVGILLLALTAGSVYVFAMGGSILGWPARNQEQKSTNIDYNPPTQEQKDAGTNIKQESIDNANKEVQKDETGKKVLDMSVNAVKNGSDLRIQTVISGSEASGTCTLTMSNQANSSPITKTADVQAQASITTCKGFTIPLSDISTGTWTITVKYSSESSTASAEQKVEI